MRYLRSIIQSSLAVVVCVAVSTATVAAAGPRPQLADQQRNLLVPAAGALLGVSSNAGDGSGISTLEYAMGRKFDVDINFYRFNSQANDILAGLDSTTIKNDILNNRTPLLTWQPHRSQNTNLSMIPEINGGHDDFYINKVATKLKGLNKLVMLRFAHEMNGDWYPWSGCNSNSGKFACRSDQAAQYVAAWRRLHDIFAAAGATNVIWVWCVSDHDYAPAGSINHHWTDFYPGDSYVDWVGFDHYINDDHISWAAAQNVSLLDPKDTQTQQFYNDYAGSKPIFLVETETGPSLADGHDSNTYNKTHYYNTVTANLRAHPSIKAIGFFDHKTTAHDYRVHNGNAGNFTAFLTMSRNCYLDSRKLQPACR